MNSSIYKLQACANQIDLVNSFHDDLNISIKEFWNIVYLKNNYSSFTLLKIPKSSGGERVLHIPPKPLKELQKKFSKILFDCLIEIKRENSNYLICNHAFEKKKSIITNAKIHRNKKYILNIDLSDFFGSIHYGRVSNFFQKDKYFQLNEKIAKTIAQLACYRDVDNRTFLPQGSPLSPIIASLIGNLLDIRLVRIAKKYKLSYSRYADDITFSSNEEIPENLAKRDNNNSIWIIGEELQKEIEKSGFKVNHKKTRLFTPQKQQTVTGIVVNKELNVSNYYQKKNRAMLHCLFQTKKFFIGESEGNINQLIGRLNYVASVKYLQQHIGMTEKEWEEAKKEFSHLCARNFDNKPESNRSIRLLRQAIFYKYFINNSKPIIIPEGVTDTTYFRLANKILNKDYKDNYLFQNLNSELAKIGLGGGTAQIKNFLTNSYGNHMIDLRKLEFKSEHPAIFILDYDEGLIVDRKSIPKQFGMEDGKQWKHIRQNIYLVLLAPLSGDSFKVKKDMVCVESLIKSSGGINISVNEKNHNLINFGKKELSKAAFSNYVVRNSQKFNFSEFKVLFDIIEEIKQHYQDEVLS